MKLEMSRRQAISLIAFLLLSCSIATIFTYSRYSKIMEQRDEYRAITMTLLRQQHLLENIQRTIEIRYSWMSQYEAEYYAYWFRKWAQRSGRDWFMFCAVARKESVFNPNAVSRKGAKGVYQILPSTFDDQCRRLGIVQRKGVAAEVLNMVCGMDYLVQNHPASDTAIEPMLRRYNSGSRTGDNAETNEYVVAVPAEMERLKYIYQGVVNENQLQDPVQKSSCGR